MDLGIGDAALAFVGVNGAEERRLAEHVMEKYPDTWRGAWLGMKGARGWAEFLEDRKELECLS